VIDVFAALTDAESGSPLVTAEIRHLGGALGEAPEGHGALGAVPGGFMLFAAGMVFDEGSAAAVRGHLDKLVHGFEPYDSGHVYTNFVDQPTATSAAFDEVTYARLRRIKAQRDPQNLFRVSRQID
jgi:Berberine and berberine like